MREKRVRKLVWLAFFSSGATALIYQMLWMRKLSLVFGNTLYGVTTILTVFMLGLGLGSLVLGRRVDKSKRPLVFYGWLELGIGLYAALTPGIFKLLAKAQLVFFKTPPQDFSSFHLVQFGLAVLGLMMPTFLMGGTLPAAGKFLTKHLSEVGKQIGRYYFINTLGAVVGVLLGSYGLISWLGVNQTIWLASLVNLLVGIGMLGWGIRMGQIKDKQYVDKKQKIEVKLEKDDSVKWLLLAYFLAGIGALSLEVIWTRALTPILGSSVYAFALMLVAFLLGIALGSMVMVKLIGKIKRPVFYLGLIEGLIGVLVLMTVPVFPRLSELFMRLFEQSGGGFFWLQVIKFGLSFLVMLGPCFLMGLAFPLVNRLAARRLKALGKSVGRVYLVNTVGSSLGPVLASFWLMPQYGVQKSLVLSAGIYFLTSLVVILVLQSQKLIKALVLFGSIVLVVIGWRLPDWNPRVLNSGVYIYASYYLENDLSLEQFSEPVFYKEGRVATVMVTESSTGVLSLKIDGKTDAGTGGDMGPQLLAGHLPMLVHQNPEEVLLIGLGSGISLGAVEQHAELKSIEAVEIEPVVVEAAEYFFEANNEAMKDPRLEMIVGDGRNYTLMTDKKYDVITAEPSNPWMTGNANLFTKEQFELYKSKLKPGGLVLQWAHTYDLKVDDFKTILATFQAVFPHTTVWQSFDGADVFLIGTQEPLKIDLANWEKKVSEEAVKADLARVYLDDPLMLLSLAVLDEEGVRGFSESARFHTDNRPVLEFQSPKGIFLDPAITRGGSFKALEDHRASLFGLTEEVGDEQLKKRLGSYALSRRHIMQGEILFSEREPVKGMMEYEKALALIVDNVLAKKRLAETFFTQGKYYLTKNLYSKAEKSFIKAINWNPGEVEFYKVLGNVYVGQNRAEEAIKVYEAALRIGLDDVLVHFQLGGLYGQKGLLGKAEQEYFKVLEVNEEDYLTYNNLAVIYDLKGDRARAVEALETSLEINLDQPKVKVRLLELKSGQ